MGTSSPVGRGRNGNPLLPTWLPDPQAPDEITTQPSPEAGEPDRPTDGGDGPDDGGGQLGSADPGRPDQGNETARPAASFTGGRTNFTRFARSGGSDRRALGRALKGYVSKASGGARTAAQRMSAERAAVRTLSGLLAASRGNPGGIRDVVRSIDMAVLASLPVEQIYAALVDHVCPSDGTLDDDYARDAYLEAVAEMTGGDADLERPDEVAALRFVASFIAHAVDHRVVNAIANGIVSLPSDLDVAKALQAGLQDFIRGCVDDALADLGGQSQVDAFQAGVEATFERVIGFIERAADSAAEEGR